MTVMELHTNEGKYLVRASKEKMRECMYMYIKRKRAAGYKLSEIIYTWSPCGVLWSPPV